MDRTVWMIICSMLLGWSTTGKASLAFYTEIDDGRYTIMKFGDTPQDIEVDIDMLSPDFHFITTSSSRGVKYDVFSSTSRSMCQANRLSMY